MAKQVVVEQHGAVALIAMNRPEARNALGMEMTLELRRAVKEAAEDKSVRAVVLTGRGGAFSAGADVREWARKVEGDDPWPDHDWVEVCVALIQDVHRLAKPTIAMIDGAAVGAGLDLSLACDFRYASSRSKFVCAYTNIAYPPDCGGTWLMPRVMGLEAAKRFCFTGELWMADTALQNRLISHVAAPEALEAETMAFARQLASGPTIAIGLAKQLMDNSFTRGLAEQQVAEQAAGKLCALTNDVAESLAAANERRAPVFTGS